MNTINETVEGKIPIQKQPFYFDWSLYTVLIWSILLGPVKSNSLKRGVFHLEESAFGTPCKKKRMQSSLTNKKNIVSVSPATEFCSDHVTRCESRRSNSPIFVCSSVSPLFERFESMSPIMSVSEKGPVNTPVMRNYNVIAVTNSPESYYNFSSIVDVDECELTAKQHVQQLLCVQQQLLSLKFPSFAKSLPSLIL